MVAIPIIVAALLAGTITSQSQVSEAPRATVVDLSKATDRLAQLFKDTCFQHRTALNDVRAVAQANQWPELAGPFPYRHEIDRSTTLIAWSVWLDGTRHQIALNTFDAHPGYVTCTVMSAPVDKARIPNAVEETINIHVIDRQTENENYIYIFKPPDESVAAIVCYASSIPQLLIGQCGLSSSLPTDGASAVSNP